ncbi:hypothetical protein PoB_001331100 [Plakobranchus ocellatus]|uniref:Uncharacterized protein n=1 Tax=Plakobranchus ocellatus TaxID=259542 RepID=A0AAV3YTQ6_9GAST|nr:hypothetical protein PoB_001331100 [Plakobranchus ocellatus]
MRVCQSVWKIIRASCRNLRRVVNKAETGLDYKICGFQSKRADSIAMGAYKRDIDIYVPRRIQQGNSRYLVSNMITMSLNSEAFDEIQPLLLCLQESNHSPESPDHRFLIVCACAQNLPQLRCKSLFQMANSPKAV